MKITVIGSGGWGTALALLLVENGHDVTLWSHRPEKAEELRRTRENPMLKGVPLPDGLALTSDRECVKNCKVVVLATPSFAVRTTARAVASLLEPSAVLVSVSKGIEKDTSLTLTDAIAQEVGEGHPIVALSGPSHAEEVGRGVPTVVVSASRDKAAAELVRKIAENYKLPYYTMSPTYSICPDHGYLSGEHFTCPKCGKTCEVWSRITGYYRPVQNWNDGKVQEFKDRQEYQVENSRLEGRRLCDRDAATEPAAGTAPSTPAERGEDGLFLFTTKTCPNCSIAKRELEKAGIAYQVMDVNEHRELVARYGIQQAPTLIVRHGEQVEKLVNASTIKKFATSQSV